MDFSTTSPTTVLKPKTKKAKYPEARVIVLDDNFNTFEHVANCLLAIIPGMSEKRSWNLAIQVDKSGLVDFRSSFASITIFGRHNFCTKLWKQSLNIQDRLCDGLS